MELIKLLTDNLGITNDQAKGGAGLLFKMAKDKLSKEEFGQVAGSIPGTEELIGAAPSSGGLGSAIGSITSAIGGKSGGLGNLASLAGGFSKLDMDSGMIGKFIPIILSFVQSKGGDVIKGLLEKVMK